MMTITEEKILVKLLGKLQSEAIEEDTRYSSSTVDCCTHIIEALGRKGVSCFTEKRR